MTTGKTIALTRQTFVGKVMSLLFNMLSRLVITFNMLSRLVITFLPRSKRLLISWLQSPSAVILEPPKMKSDTVSTVSPSISHEVMGHTSKLMLKILQARLQQYRNQELPDVQVGFRKSRETKDQIANICCFIEKAREFQKIIYSALLTMPKALTVWITINWGKF